MTRNSKDKKMLNVNSQYIISLAKDIWKKIAPLFLKIEVKYQSSKAFALVFTIACCVVACALLKALTDSDIVVASVAASVAVINFFLSKQKEREEKQRNAKEEQYITFLRAFITLYTLSRIKENNRDTVLAQREASIRINSTIQLINLVGSPEVVEKANAFLDLLTKGNQDGTQDRRYAPPKVSNFRGAYQKEDAFLLCQCFIHLHISERFP